MVVPGSVRIVGSRNIRIFFSSGCAGRASSTPSCCCGGSSCCFSFCFCVCFCYCCCLCCRSSEFLMAVMRRSPLEIRETGVGVPCRSHADLVLVRIVVMVVVVMMVVVEVIILILVCCGNVVVVFCIVFSKNLMRSCGWARR